jgi:hypothetical protein
MAQEKASLEHWKVADKAHLLHSLQNHRRRFHHPLRRLQFAQICNSLVPEVGANDWLAESSKGAT